MSTRALKEIHRLAKMAMGDMTDVLEYGSVDKVEEEKKILESVQVKLQAILRYTHETLETAITRLCPICGTPMYWEDCDICGGIGHLDVYELDPLWYDPGDVEVCKLCDGDGGWYTCPNYHNHPTENDRTASDVDNEPK